MAQILFDDIRFPGAAAVLRHIQRVDDGLMDLGYSPESRYRILQAKIEELRERLVEVGETPTMFKAIPANPSAGVAA